MPLRGTGPAHRTRAACNASACPAGTMTFASAAACSCMPTIHWLALAVAVYNTCTGTAKKETLAAMTGWRPPAAAARGPAGVRVERRELLAVHWPVEPLHSAAERQPIPEPRPGFRHLGSAWVSTPEPRCRNPGPLSRRMPAGATQPQNAAVQNAAVRCILRLSGPGFRYRNPGPKHSSQAEGSLRLGLKDHDDRTVALQPRSQPPACTETAAKSPPSFSLPTL